MKILTLASKMYDQGDTREANKLMDLGVWGLTKATSQRSEKLAMDIIDLTDRITDSFSAVRFLETEVPRTTQKLSKEKDSVIIQILNKLAEERFSLSPVKASSLKLLPMPKQKMVSLALEFDKGGIDFDSTELNLNNASSTLQFNLPLKTIQQFKSSSGLSFEILGIEEGVDVDSLIGVEKN